MSAPKTAVSVSLAALAGVIVAKGPELFTTLTAGVDFLARASERTPLGFASFTIGLAVGVASMGFLRRFIPEPKRRDLMHVRMAFIELIPMAAAFFSVWLQKPDLLGAIIACLAALVVSVVYRILAAIGSTIARRWTIE
jgi:hypothetical protein